MPMQTIVLEEPGRFVLTEQAWPAPPAPGMARVRVKRVGVCGTDIHAYRGRQPFFSYPRILGHELGVEIEAVGDNAKGLQPGDRCAVEPYLNCGKCIACRRGKTNCCTTLQCLGVHTDGGMREQILLPVNKLHPSRTLTLDQLCLVETLGIGAHAVARTQLEAGEFALVIGAGPIGLSAMQFAKAAGAKVIAMDVNAQRLAFCRNLMRVEHVLLAGPNALEELSAITSGDLATAVLDATGNPESMMQAFHHVAHGGRLTYVGLFQGDVTFHDPDFHRKEITLLATRNSTAADFLHIIAQMESGVIDTTPWITHRASSHEMIAQFPGWLAPDSGVLKAVVEFA